MNLTVTNQLNASTLSASSTLTGQLCIEDESGTSCYTRSQLDSLLSGSVLGANTPENESGDEEAADAQQEEPSETPAVPVWPPQTDTDASISTSTPSAVETPSEDPVEIPEPVSELPAAPALEVVLQAANDNAPMPDLQATGTE